jgi:hypothetical protein
MMSTRTSLRLVPAAVLALAVVACGGQSAAPDAASPTAPTTVPSPAPLGATVSGTVAVISGAQGVTGLHAASSYTIVVSVVGTSLSTAADGTGHFKLTGVPSGTVILKFSGNGLQGTITLTGVKEADEIAVSVNLSPSGATLDTGGQDSGGSVQLEGRISELNPGGAAATFMLDSTMVSVPAGTDIRHGDSAVPFASLQVGDRVHVKGTRNGQTVVASQVIVQNTNSNVPVNIKGAVTELLAGFSCPAIRFKAEGWTVETTAATSFEKGTCAAVAVGTSVHVKGTTQSSGRVLATWVQIGK